jgi:hypothetical protein
MGNYEYSAGFPANTLTDRFALYSKFKLAYTPKTLGFIIIWTALVLALLYKKRSKMLMVFGLILIGLSQVLVSIIGAGDADLAKHIFLYNVSFDIVNVILIANIAGFFDNIYQKKHPRLPLVKIPAESDADQSIYKNT